MIIHKLHHYTKIDTFFKSFMKQAFFIKNYFFAASVQEEGKAVGGNQCRVCPSNFELSQPQNPREEGSNHGHAKFAPMQSSLC